LAKLEVFSSAVRGLATSIPGFDTAKTIRLFVFAAALAQVLFVLSVRTW